MTRKKKRHVSGYTRGKIKKKKNIERTRGRTYGWWRSVNEKMSYRGIQ